jgi:hypothetical protein
MDRQQELAGGAAVSMASGSGGESRSVVSYCIIRSAATSVALACAHLSEQIKWSNS